MTRRAWIDLGITWLGLVVVYVFGNELPLIDYLGVLFGCLIVGMATSMSEFIDVTLAYHKLKKLKERNYR